MRFSDRSKRRTAVVAALVVFVAVAAAAVLSLTATGGRAAAHKRLVAVGCRAGTVAENDGGCSVIGGPEGPIETFVAAEQRASKATAPFQTVAPGALANALAQRAKKQKVSGTWAPLGSTPLYANSPDYAGTDPVLNSGVSRLGWVKLSGRITAFTYDPRNTSRIFAAPATGGVWETTDGGNAWRSVGDGIPSQAMGGVAFSTANGGTLLAGTGDNAVGGIFTPTGLGVFASRDDGKTWTKATGVPDELTTYKVVVDPNNPNVSYVATSKGLFRSSDDGVSYANVNLPTPAVDKTSGALIPNGCAGDTSSTPQCEFANTVSDVAVQQGSGAVIAAVGWAYGQMQTKAGYTMAPQNGIYTSPSGAPGSFTFQNPGASAPTSNGFAPTPVVGRTTLAVANGPGQNHDVVYALVQDATEARQLPRSRRSMCPSAPAPATRCSHRRRSSTRCTSRATSAGTGRR